MSTVDGTTSTIESADQNQPTKSDTFFDPNEHDADDGIGSMAAAVHVVRASIGCGMLVMPYIMMRAGYVTGTFVIFAVAGVYFHVLRTLLATEYRVCRRLHVARLNFVELTDTIFEHSSLSLVRRLRTGVRNILYAYYVVNILNAVVLIIIAHQVHDLCAKYVGVQIDAGYVVLATVVPLATCCMFRSLLKCLAPFSSATNVFSFAVAALVIADAAYRRAGQPTPSVRPFGDVAYTPDCFVVCLHAMCCTSTLFSVKKHMKRPRAMSTTFGSLNVAAATIVAFYYAFSVTAYFSYGDAVRVNVLQNMGDDDPILDVVRLLYTMTLCVSYVLCFSVRFDNVWSNRLERRFAARKWRLAAEYGIRLGSNAIVYLLAVGVPNLMIVSTLTGSVTIAIELALPVVLQLSTLYDDGETRYYIVVKDTLILVASLALFCASLSGCLMQIVGMYYD